MYQDAEAPTAVAFPLYPEGIPAELKPAKSWVCCDREKVPMVAGARQRRASSTDPTTWRSYEQALAALASGRYAGLGRVIEEASAYVGLDLDNVRDAGTGQIASRAWEILESLDSYSEVSPSGKGVKVWLKAPDLKIAHVKPGLEIYPRRRYFTITGQFLPQFSTAVEERSAELRRIIREEFPKPKNGMRAYAGGAGADLDLDETIADSGIEVLAVVADGTARTKYRVLCPWADEHTDNPETGTYMGQYESGALFFKCHHAHCAHRQWKDFRKEHYTPWWIKVVKKDG